MTIRVLGDGHMPNLVERAERGFHGVRRRTLGTSTDKAAFFGPRVTLEGLELLQLGSSPSAPPLINHEMDTF